MLGTLRRLGVGVALLLPGGAAWAQYLDQPRERCPLDLAEPFGVVNFFDLARFVQLHAARDPRADIVAPWGSIDFFDLAAFVNYFAQGCQVDSDGDGIPDWAETNDGMFRGPFATGTDPFNADTDGDGLSDGDEIYGTEDGLDLPALGADPFRKDIFVECDWFSGVVEGVFRDFRPRALAVQRIVEAFAQAPVPNPFGREDGITIHLDSGQGGVFTGGNQLPGNPVFVTFPADFQAYKAEHFDPRRLGYFHYAVFANRHGSADNRSSGVAEIVGDDLMVTMVDYLSSYNQATTFVHELGHNLGLRHGGFENRNWKPNYNSVMNYRHQFTGVDISGDSWGNGVIDFSRGTNLSINESAVFEPLGVAGVPVDFNLDGVIQTVPYARNLNCPNGTSAPCGSGTASGCADTVCTVLADHDDWSSLLWSRLAGVRSREAAEISDCRNEPGLAPRLWRD